MVPIALRCLAVLGLMAAASTVARAAPDFRDIPYLQARIGQALEREANGVAVDWLNEATGNSGTIRVLRTFYKDANVPCRDYVRTMRKAGAPDTLVRGTGCREAGGRWQLKEGGETTARSSGSGTTSSGSMGTAPAAGQTQGQESGQWSGQGQTQGQTQGQWSGQSQTQIQGQSQESSQWLPPDSEEAPVSAAPTPLFEPEPAAHPAPAEEIPIVMPTPSE